MSTVEVRRISAPRLPASMDQERLQGWLNLSNANEAEGLDQLEWNKRYCVLAKDERKLFFFNDTESVLASPLSPAKFKFSDDQDGQCASTQRKNALTLFDPVFSNFQRGTRQSRSFRDKVKSSLQKSVKRTTAANPQKVEGFSGGGSVRVARSRSFGKVDRLDVSPAFQSSMKLGSSLDNLHRVGSSGTPDTHYVALGEHDTFLDLAMRGNLNVQVVHQSISPRHSCFRIITDSDILYVSCGSQEDLHRWVTNLAECQRPNRNHLRRQDTQLSVWILEARHLTPKKRYYCEICLNGIHYAQTCVKMMNDILFWGEPFIFDDLPPLGSVTIKLWKENYKKRKERPSASDLGKIEIPTLLLEDGTLEKWHPVSMFAHPKGGSGAGKERETPSIRMKMLYKVVAIEPLKVYDDFLKYLKSDYSTVCSVLEPVISAKAKDEIAQTLVRILQVGGRIKDFLCNVIMAEVQHVDNENLIFRGNTFATKAVDTYMKLVGDSYLRDTLKPFICVVLECEEDCEVDPMKISAGASLPQNQVALTHLVQEAWMFICRSIPNFPSDLRNTLCGIRQRFGPEREEACMKLISGSIFLRFFCPAILSPSLFRLCQEYPVDKTSRKLTLVAKVVQNLANFARFGAKEEYMCFMNGFVEKEISTMKQFIDKISSPLSDREPVVPWGPCNIDLGREASIMHTTLQSQLKAVQLDEEAQRRIERLPVILQQITQSAEEDEEDPFSSTFEALRVMQSTISTFNSKPPTPAQDKAGSDTSSEYTTPAQSQSSSPIREQSPPPSFQPPSLLALNVHPSPHPEQLPLFGSPSTSPTHTGSLVSRLATHGASASRTTSQEDRGRTSPPGGARHGGRAEAAGGSPRRCSDPGSRHFSTKMQTCETEYSSGCRDDATTENQIRLLDEVERLQRIVDQQRREYDHESERMRRELSRTEDSQRRSDHELKTLRDNRGKILRGLNTQTEIALVQFKRDFENLKRQLQAKDEIIGIQERKIAGLVEANLTLRNGLQELHAIPKHEDSESDDEEVHVAHGGGRTLSNGTGATASQASAAQFTSDLMHAISQLQSGKFEL